MAVSSASIAGKRGGTDCIDAIYLPHHPFEKIHVMAGLIGEDTSVHRGPCPTPGVLIVIGLRPAPPHPHGSQYKFPEAASVERFARLNHRHIETVLLDDEELQPHPRSQAVINGIGIIERQSHGLLHDDVFSIPGKIDDVLSMPSAFGQDDDDVHVGCVASSRAYRRTTGRRIESRARPLVPPRDHIRRPGEPR